MTDLVRAARVEARLVPHHWAWADDNAGAIAANWERRLRTSPAIFNGRVLMAAGGERVGQAWRARFFATDYANLLAWIDGGYPDPSVANGFAMGALQTADGAFLLGRMAAGTANAGRLYFPCGTPDLADVAADGTVDLAASLVREMEEETGIGPDEVAIEDGWTIVRSQGLLAFMRRVRLALDAEPARARILRHLASQTDPELADIRIVRAPGDIDASSMPAVVPIYLRDALDAGPARPRGRTGWRPDDVGQPG